MTERPSPKEKLAAAREAKAAQNKAQAELAQAELTSL